jgi:predicted RNA-binding protein with PIN domain
VTIIDGNNLLWAIQEKFEEREITTDVELCRVLDRYFAATVEEGQIVFDGAGPADKSEFNSVTHVEIYFAGFHKDSDSVIEEKIKANTAPRLLRVVSSDRRLRKAAGLRKATAIKSEDFWAEVQKELRRKKPQRREPMEKKEGLTESETDRWMDLFGVDQ